MNGSHFYLMLPSNASLSTFPDNKTTNYRVKLPQPIDLNGNWEVGLYSITYPRTWYNLQEHDSAVKFSDDGLVFLSSFVDYGYYTSVQDLVGSINKALLNDAKGNISMTFDTRTEKVTIRPQNGYYFAMDGMLSILLGFGGENVKITKDTTSPYVVDITGAMNTIYVYCDIVQPQVIGDTNASLLRTVSIEGKAGEVVTRTYNNTQYIPLQTKSFGDIQILLRDDTGKPVPFERGKVVITLHFRERSYFT